MKLIEWSALLAIFLSASATITAAQDSPEKVIRSFPSRVESTSTKSLFLSIPPEQSGLDFIIPIDSEHPDSRLFYSAMACGSVAVGDLDGDDWPDLFFAGGPSPNRLYRNQCEDSNTLHFRDVSAEGDLAAADSWCTGVAMIDIDNDGDLDLYLCRYGEPNLLFLNESKPGKFAFREASEEWGLDLVDASLMPSFADFDRDGDLDLFLVANAYYRKGGRPKEGIPMRKTDRGWEVVAPWDRYFAFSSLDPETGEPKYDECGRPNRLLRNEGTRFTDITREAGLKQNPFHTNSAVWWDFDSDGWLDLYVANDFDGRDFCYHNRGDGTFSEVAADLFQHTSWFSMGAAAEDFNGDSLTDLIVADMSPTTHYRQKVTMGEMGASFDAMRAAGFPRQKMVNSFFVNSGTNLFFEAARQAGIASTDWTWTVKSGDLDSDGRIDLYFTTGHTRDFVNSDYPETDPSQRIGTEDWDLFVDRPELRENDLAFRNVSGSRNDFRFEEIGSSWGLGKTKTMTYGGALSDLDRDGDLDLVTIRLEEPPGLYQNQASANTGKNNILIGLRSSQGNRHGIGARITAKTADGTIQTRTLLTNNGYQESDEPLVHFGLGKNEKIDTLTIEWPSGTRQELKNVLGNRWLEIAEPDSPKREAALEEPVVAPLFRSSNVLSSLGAPETPFDDFLRQPLLPHQHSQLGPGQAWGDVDGDGAEDLYLGSPRGQSGRLLLHRGTDPKQEPIFALRRKPPFTDMAAYEDLGSLFFEADGDGDLDLLIASGSVEGKPGDAIFRDRLYLNEGNGEFVEAPGHLPSPADGKYSSASTATAADFDRDGDLDVFIGGRIVPGEYPVPARNRLLVNNGEGRFTDEAEAFGIAETGLVTAALWTDTDGDGWIDLLVAHEWGAIRSFLNEEGNKLRENTASAGLSEATGFWNSIAGRDLDGDGDIDYLAGNLGNNTKYHATPDTPEILYYGSFDETGRKNLIEAKPDKKHDQLIPRRGLSCSSRAIPSLGLKINTYHDWASSSLKQLYNPTQLEEALRLEATAQESMFLINDGKGHFELRPLPPMAQLAPLFGIALSDLNSDGLTDAVLAQNFFATQEETGAHNGGLSLVLMGESDSKEGTPGFRVLWPEESGVAVPADAKSLGLGDLNGDQRPDLVFGNNGSAPSLYLHEGSGPHLSLPIQLKGSKGNPTAIGARIEVSIEGLPLQTAEVAAGDGYLTQRSSVLFFGWGNGDGDATVKVRWPSGKSSIHSISRGNSTVHQISEG